MNLCSHVIRDIIDEETYTAIRENLFKSHINPWTMNHRRMMDKTFDIPSPFGDSVLPNSSHFGSMRDYPKPDMFYPLFPDEEQDLIEYEEEILQ